MWLWHWLCGFVQRQVLDRFYYTRAFLLNGIVWFAIRLTGYELTFANVKERTVPNRSQADLCLDHAGDLDGLLTHAKAQVTEATVRRAIVTDKCKTLFTFNTALLALIAVFQGKTAELHSWEIMLFYLAVVNFVVSLLVVWTYFDVGGEIVTPLDRELVALCKDDLKKSLINSYLHCASDSDNRTDFLVDLYRTSRFFLMSGFVLLFIVFSHNYFVRAGTSPKQEAASKVVEMNERCN